jgi:N-acetylglucosaminyl-diphospho-decaprenol L-rhamnosyltransferase
VSSAPALSIAVGIVVFNNSDAELADLARSLRRAVERLVEAQSTAGAPTAVSVLINLHDNGTRPADITPFGPSAHVTRSPENLGFGRAHNFLMRRAFAENADFYITVNPDGYFIQMH